MKIQAPVQRWLRYDDAAKYLGTTPGNLRKNVCLGVGPKSYGKGKGRLFDVHDLDAYVQSRPSK